MNSSGNSFQAKQESGGTNNSKLTSKATTSTSSRCSVFTAHRAKMKELVGQRALHELQKEEEERSKQQKAKALAKLEELNRRMQAGDALSQKAINDSSPDIMRKAAREVLGISSGRNGGHKGDWWWNAVVQDKVEAKKAAYLRFVGSSGEKERRANSERYKVARREAKMAVMEAKMTTFARLYEELGNKGGEKKLFRLAKRPYLNPAGSSMQKEIVALEWFATWD
ncbi:uncharacterized protein [Nicotiana sylvestris]|uniref:uncharacterized protein n=1 Tax=Nicotiana sylvestris TaxID=4096 RepID=UPI00388CC57F